MEIVNTLINNIDLIIDTGLQLIEGLILGIINAIPELIRKLPIVIDNLVQKLTDPETLGKIFRVGVRLIIQLATALVESIPELLWAVAQLGVSLIKGLINQFKSIPEIGKNIVKGIWEGISSSAQWLLNKIKEWCGSILNGIKAFFGIHSPSKVMKDQIGQWLPKGIAVGIEANTDSVMKAVDDMDNAMMNKLEKSVAVETGKMNINAQAKANSMFGQVIQINARFDGNVEMDKQKTGRILAPVITKTIKVGGLS